MSDAQTVQLTVNGVPRALSVDPATSLADALRHDLGLTALHLGCEHGVCGACGVLADGMSVRACLMLSVQAEGLEITTLEGLAEDARMQALKTAFRQRFALQCGFCTPGMLITALDLLASTPDPTESQVRDALSGNLCRCTGYQPIIAAVLDAAAALSAGEA